MTTTSGPGQLLVIALPDTSAEQVIRAVSAVDTDAIRILDLVIVSKTGDGALDVVEIEDLGDEIDISELELAGSGLTGDDDIDVIGAGLESGDSALVVVIEHLWAASFAASVASTGGAVVATEWIPAAVIDQIRAETAVA